MNEKQTNKNAVKLLFIGNFEHEEAPMLLLRAIRRSHNKSNIEALFIGSGKLQGKIERKANRIGLKSFEIKPYKQEELTALVNSCDIYCCPSKREINAISCVDIISNGAIPIYSNLSGSSGILLDECSYFESGNARDLCDKIDFIVNHPSFSRELSKRYLTLVNA